MTTSNHHPAPKKHRVVIKRPALEPFKINAKCISNIVGGIFCLLFGLGIGLLWFDFNSTAFVVLSWWHGHGVNDFWVFLFFIAGILIILGIILIIVGSVKWSKNFKLTKQYKTSPVSTKGKIVAGIIVPSIFFIAFPVVGGISNMFIPKAINPTSEGVRMQNMVILNDSQIQININAAQSFFGDNKDKTPSTWDALCATSDEAPYIRNSFHYLPKICTHNLFKCSVEANVSITLSVACFISIEHFYGWVWYPFTYDFGSQAIAFNPPEAEGGVVIADLPTWDTSKPGYALMPYGFSEDGFKDAFDKANAEDKNDFLDNLSVGLTIKKDFYFYIYSNVNWLLNDSPSSSTAIIDCKSLDGVFNVFSKKQDKNNTLMF